MPELQLNLNETLANRWVITYKQGRGKGGGTVYGVKDPLVPGASGTVLKYPVREEELTALKAIFDHSPSFLGIPQIHDWVFYRDQPFLVMDRLGVTIKDMFKDFQGSFSERWRHLQILGRMLVRRFRELHRCGVVHSDVQPGNILMGRGDTGVENGNLMPYLIDFGCAQRFPDGKPVRADWGSVDFNSILSAEEGCRGPGDDLESLGWVMCNILVGDLPWFVHTKEAEWKNGKLDQITRSKVCGSVQQAKIAFLESRELSFGPAWSHLERVPSDLLQFIRLAGSNNEFPDYTALIQILGGDDSVSFQKAEMSDLHNYHTLKHVEVSDNSDAESDGGPVGTWSFNRGKSVYQIVESAGEQILWYTQPLAGGKMLTGQLITPNYLLEDDELQQGNVMPDKWQWLVELNNKGRLRMRRQDSTMVTSYCKSKSQTWNNEITAVRVRTHKKQVFRVS